MSGIQPDAEEVIGSYPNYYPSLNSTYPTYDPMTARQHVQPPHAYQISPMPPFPNSLPYTPSQYQYQHIPPFHHSLPPNQRTQMGHSLHAMPSLPAPAPAYLPTPEDVVYSQREDFDSLIGEITVELEKDPKVVGELKFILSDLVPRDELSNVSCLL